MTMDIKSYKDLEVWKKGIEIVDYTYDLTENFPSHEKFSLATHMQKTAISIPSNVAEGYARQYKKEYQQFCSIALGSCSELETQAIIAGRRNYIETQKLAHLEELLDHESRMLKSLVRALRGFK